MYFDKEPEYRDKEKCNIGIATTQGVAAAIVYLLILTPQGVIVNAHV